MAMWCVLLSILYRVSLNRVEQDWRRPWDFVGCGQDLSSTPPRYRPILFWFFKYESQLTWITLCTPHATSQLVSAATDAVATRTGIHDVHLHTSNDASDCRQRHRADACPPAAP